MWILKVSLLSVCLFIVFARPQDSTSSDEDDSGSDSDETTESIVEHTESVGKDGSYNYSYETSNGIKVEQYNYVKLLPSGRSDSDSGSDEEIHVQQGSYSYTAPDGTVISLSYTADENGFQPEGDHLPTLSPIADILLKKQLSEESSDDSDSKDSDESEESGKHRKGKSHDSDDDDDSDDEDSSENSKSQDDDDEDSGSNGKSDDKD